VKPVFTANQKSKQSAPVEQTTEADIRGFAVVQFQQLDPIWPVKTNINYFIYIHVDFMLVICVFVLCCAACQCCSKFYLCAFITLYQKSLIHLLTSPT